MWEFHQCLVSDLCMGDAGNIGNNFFWWVHSYLCHFLSLSSKGTEDAAVHVTLISGYHSTTVTNLFQYDPSLNPEIVSLSRNRSGIAGEKAADVYWGIFWRRIVIADGGGAEEFGL